MSSFRDPGYRATLEWLGCVGDRALSLRSSGRKEAFFSFAGMEEESHGGLTRAACVRVEDLYEEGTEIRNTRQVSVVSSEELESIAEEMGLDSIDPGLLGANMVVRGIPDFTLVPPCSRLQFAGGVTLTIDLENLPCNLPAREIEIERSGFGRRFKAAAECRRGITAWVEREGTVRVGEGARLFVPVQKHWPHDVRGRSRPSGPAGD